RTPERRYPDLMADADLALADYDLNPLVVRFDPCPGGEAKCQCHDPDQARWKFVVGHELGHHVQTLAGGTTGYGNYTFECPADTQNCPALGTQERALSGRLFDPPFVASECGC